jgi:bifunctional UDP-N-acetylglucosamine pyrophosphorylase/glucosamine-1-phosphate N-acetyltransferase
MSRNLAIVVLAAGRGTRTKVSLPKMLLPLCGRTLVTTVLDEVAALGAQRTVVVVHHGRDRIAAALADRDALELVDQGEPRGTGHAVQVAMRVLAGFEGNVLVVNGDGALIRGATLAELVSVRDAEAAAAVLLTSVPPDPSGYGRIVRGENLELVAIREHRDCSAEELEIDEINAGFYCFDAARLRSVLDRLDAHNDQGELYLTDAIGHLVADGAGVVTMQTEDHEQTLGVNSLAELAEVRAIMQDRILLRHLGNGVIIEDPATTYIDQDVEIGPDTRILPCTVIRSGVRIGSGCEVGPFAHLRAAAVMADGSEIGNFVEVKKSVIGKGTKAKHLAYLGDTTIGERANIGAGTITANYDGKNKHATTIEDGAFIGSGTVLIAPCTVGKRAKTGAGAIVTRNAVVPEGDVWVGLPARPIGQRKEARP